jgi:hypothetical protein
VLKKLKKTGEVKHCEFFIRRRVCSFNRKVVVGVRELADFLTYMNRLRWYDKF